MQTRAKRRRLALEEQKRAVTRSSVPSALVAALTGVPTARALSPQVMVPIMDMLDVRTVSALVVVIRGMGRSGSPTADAAVAFLQSLLRLKVIHDYTTADQDVLYSDWFRHFVTSSVRTVRTLSVQNVHMPPSLWEALIGTGTTEISVLRWSPVDSVHEARMVAALQHARFVTQLQLDLTLLRSPLAVLADTLRNLVEALQNARMSRLRTLELNADDQSPIPAGALSLWLPTMPELRRLRLNHVDWNEDDVRALTLCPRLRIIDWTAGFETKDLPLPVVRSVFAACPRLHDFKFRRNGAAVGWERDLESLESVEAQDWSFYVAAPTYTPPRPPSLSFDYQLQALAPTMLGDRRWRIIGFSVQNARRVLVRLVPLLTSGQLQVQRLMVRRNRLYTLHSFSDRAEPWLTDQQVQRTLSASTRSLLIQSGDPDREPYLDVVWLPAFASIDALRIHWHTLAPWVRHMSSLHTLSASVLDIRQHHINDLLNLLVHRPVDQLHKLDIGRLIEDPTYALDEWLPADGAQLTAVLQRNGYIETLRVHDNLLQWTPELLHLLVERSGIWRHVRLYGQGVFPRSVLLGARDWWEWSIATIDPGTDPTLEWPAPQRLAPAADEKAAEAADITERDLEEFSRHNPQLTRLEWLAYPPRLRTLPVLHARGLTRVAFALTLPSVSTDALEQLARDCPLLEALHLDFPDAEPAYPDDWTTGPFSDPPPTPGRVWAIVHEQERIKRLYRNIPVRALQRGWERLTGGGRVRLRNVELWRFIKVDWPRPEELKLQVPDVLMTAAWDPQDRVSTGLPNLPDVTLDEARSWLDRLRTGDRLPIRAVRMVRTGRALTPATGVRWALETSENVVLDFRHKLAVSLVHTHHRYPIPLGFRRVRQSSLLPRTVQWALTSWNRAAHPVLLHVILVHLWALNPETPLRVVVNRLLEASMIPGRAYLRRVRSLLASPAAPARSGGGSDRQPTSLRPGMIAPVAPPLSVAVVRPAQRWKQALATADPRAVGVEETRLQQWLDDQVTRQERQVEWELDVRTRTSSLLAQSELEPLVWVHSQADPVLAAAQRLVWRRRLQTHRPVRIVRATAHSAAAVTGIHYQGQRRGRHHVVVYVRPRVVSTEQLLSLHQRLRCLLTAWLPASRLTVTLDWTNVE